MALLSMAALNNISEAWRTFVVLVTQPKQEWDDIDARTIRQIRAVNAPTQNQPCAHSYIRYPGLG